jgi:hypothetical protein
VCNGKFEFSNKAAGDTETEDVMDSVIGDPWNNGYATTKVIQRNGRFISGT